MTYEIKAFKALAEAPTLGAGSRSPKMYKTFQFASIDRFLTADEAIDLPTARLLSSLIKAAMQDMLSGDAKKRRLAREWFSCAAAPIPFRFICLFFGARPSHLLSAIAEVVGRDYRLERGLYDPAADLREVHALPHPLDCHERCDPCHGMLRRQAAIFQ